MGDKVVKVGLLGLGTVGGGVARLLMEKREQLSAYLGVELELARAVDLEPSRAADLGLEPGVYSSDAWSVLEDRDIDIVVETVGGLEPARAMVLTAINKGKGVVTANKALLASHGVEIFHAARQRQVGIAFEASVGGGIPLVRSLRDSLAANRVTSCLGILNGTCNFILSRMTAEGAPFGQVLAQAQAKGYAEADPTFDVEGTDTAHKLAIVASLVTGAQPRLDDIPTEGITKITPLDIQFAGEFGFKIKLLAVLNNQGGKVEARVHPALVPHDHLLASVDGPFNALHVNGDWVGQVLLYGQGAGRSPTASAVVGDILELARDVAAGVPGRVPPLGTDANGGRLLELASLDDAVCQYYCRFAALDQPGVLAAVARELGEFGISIEKVTQKGRQEAGPVPIVMLTHEAHEADMRRALRQIDALPAIVEPTMVIRMA
ncbi:MAG: homoserine dehydrogenase [Desulfarculaceae bacterium]|nr:homoserine dehydrogenase [Desulfarculaceae bacterium]